MTEARRCAVREPALRAVLERGWRKTARQVPGLLGSLLGGMPINVFTFRGPLRGYLARARDPQGGFLSLPLFLKDGTGLSLRL